MYYFDGHRNSKIRLHQTSVYYCILQNPIMYPNDNWQVYRVIAIWPIYINAIYKDARDVYSRIYDFTDCYKYFNTYKCNIYRLRFCNSNTSLYKSETLLRLRLAYSAINADEYISRISSSYLRLRDDLLSTRPDKYCEIDRNIVLSGRDGGETFSRLAMRFIAAGVKIRRTWRSFFIYFFFLLWTDCCVVKRKINDFSSFILNRNRGK